MHRWRGRGQTAPLAVTQGPTAITVVLWEFLSHISEFKYTKLQVVPRYNGPEIVMDVGRADEVVWKMWLL